MAAPSAAVEPAFADHILNKTKQNKMAYYIYAKIPSIHKLWFKIYVYEYPI